MTTRYAKAYETKILESRTTDRILRISSIPLIRLEKHNSNPLITGLKLLICQIDLLPDEFLLLDS